MADPIALKYRAFISYSHADTGLAKWLHRALEGFTIDKDLVGRETFAGTIPKTLRPIFRDRDEFTAGHALSDQTLAALDASHALAVICSPTAAKSHYVNEEIRLFKSRHPERAIIPLIAGGKPDDPELECFPSALKFKLDAEGRTTKKPVEILAADAREEGDGKSLALAKVVAGVLGVSSDDIFRRAMRERRRRQQRWIAGLFVVALSLAGLAVWAEINRREAIEQEKAAIVERDRALSNQWRLLSLMARGAKDREETRAAVSLGLEVFLIPNRAGVEYEWDTIQNLNALVGNSGVRETEIDYFFSVDGRESFRVLPDGTARASNNGEFGLSSKIEGHAGKISSGAFSRDRLHIVAASLDKTARLWNGGGNGEDKKLVAILPGHTDLISASVFSADGTRLLTTSFDRTARVWDANTGALVTEIIGHDDKIVGGAFSPDSRKIVTASIDKTARIWDATSGKVVGVLRHPSELYDAAFSLDGRRVVTITTDQTIRVWDANAGTLVETIAPVMQFGFAGEQQHGNSKL